MEGSMSLLQCASYCCKSLPGSSILLLSSEWAGALADSKKKLLKGFFGRRKLFHWRM